MSLDEIVELLGTRAMLAVVLLLIGSGAGLAAIPLRARWLAAVAVLMPILALTVTAFELTAAHTRALELHGLIESRTPLPPDGYRLSAIRSVLNPAPVLIGLFAAILLPLASRIAANIWYPEPGQRAFRATAIGAAGVVAIALCGASLWAGEFIFPMGFVNVGCPDRAWRAADRAYASLSQIRTVIVVAGVILGAGLIALAIAQARCGCSLSPRGWAGLLTLLGVASAAKLATADERRDTQDYFRREPAGHYGFGHFLGHVPDPVEGPNLQHCTFDWPGADMIRLTYDGELSPAAAIGDVEFLEWCGEDAGLDVILADPSVPIAHVKLVLKTADELGRRRLGVASLRPEPTSRATVGDFIRVRSCAVEFRLGGDGVPLERFSTWGELAAAVDAAEGDLVIAP